MVGFLTAPAIAWGTGALQQLSGLGARRAAFVMDPAVAGQEGAGRAIEELERAGASVVRVSEPTVSLRAAAVAELAAKLRSADPDWIVAIGGGTTMDATKAARLLLERPDLTLEPPPVDIAVPSSPRCRLVAIPTTCGSGAEASWAVDLVSAEDAPIEIADRSLVPDWAIVDPLFVRDLPVAGVVATALEAAAGACEAFLSAWSNPFSDALAVETVRTVVRRLPHAVRWSDDPEARAALLYAGTMSGIAQSNAQRGVAHALARALVRPTGLSYGTILGIVLPAVLEFDRPAARERLEMLGEATRENGPPAAPPLPERLRKLAGGLGAPASLSAAGVAGERLRTEADRIVRETLRLPAVLGNPRVPTEVELRALLSTVSGVALT